MCSSVSRGLQQWQGKAGCLCGFLHMHFGPGCSDVGRLAVVIFFPWSACTGRACLQVASLIVRAGAPHASSMSRCQAVLSLWAACAQGSCCRVLGFGKSAGGFAPRAAVARCWGLWQVNESHTPAVGFHDACWCDDVCGIAATGAGATVSKCTTCKSYCVCDVLFV